MMNKQFVPVSNIDFADIAAEDRFPMWKEIGSVVFESDLKPEDQLKPFTATINTYHLSSVLLTRASTVQQYFNRDLKLIAKDGLDHCLIQIYLKGSTSGQWSKHNNSTVRAGDIFLLDFTQPITSFATDMDCLSFIIPRGMLLSKLPQLEHLHGKVLPRESAVARLLGQHIKTLYSVSQSVTEEEACSVAEGVVNLIATYFNQTALDEGCQHVQTATRESIRCYIIKNLSNPNLSPESIANYFKISRAYLYTLFDSSEGIKHYIYQQRLLKAFNLLSNPAINSTLRISKIAYDLGFNSESHFSRSFRQAFGLTPSAVRNNARMNECQKDSNLTVIDQRFEKWILSLR